MRCLEKIGISIVALLVVFAMVSAASAFHGFNARQIRQGQRAQARVAHRQVQAVVVGHHAQQLRVQQVVVPSYGVQQLVVPQQLNNGCHQDGALQLNGGCQALYR